jgi:predicted Ser/Thr protein kinase
MASRDENGGLPPEADLRTDSTGDSGTSVPSLARHGQFLPGALFGRRYRIVGLLGRGGMAEVYQADDLELGQTVALKFLPRHLSDDDALDRLRGEVRMARQVSHPNVCRVYDLGEVEGRYFVSMEYVDGEDLASLLRRIGRLAREKALDIARQLCAGLAAAHERGILHRDLKPANIIIDGRGRVRIMDFGLAGLAAQYASGGERAGTPAYMSPEQLRGDGLTVQSDLYALGLVLFELFAGKRPFPATSMRELLRQQEEGPASSLTSFVSGLEAGIEEVVQRCLAFRPQDRPESALAVAVALPGGDPLAAAVAAGETPSPGMVAAAGGRGAVPLWAAALGVVAVLLCFVGIAKLNDRTATFRLIDQPLSPEVLADRAGQLLDELGIPRLPHRAYGLMRTSGPVLMIAATSRAPDRWHQLRPLSSFAQRFWYRESLQELTPLRVHGYVRPDDPWPGHLGSTFLELDGLGRLRLLSWVPELSGSDALPGGPPDWSLVAERAGLDLALLSPVAGPRPPHLQYTRVDPPVWPPAPPRTEQWAWEGSYPGRELPRLRVDGLAWRGQPIFFRVQEDWLPQGEVAARGPTARETRMISSLQGPVSGLELAQLVIFLVMILGALTIARHNLRRGRGDPRSAWRFGLAVFVLELMSSLLVRDSWRNLLDYYRLPEVIGWPLFWGALAGLAYLALEPIFRRHWPDSLISWTRLLAGRLSDPMIGRDVLAGAATGSLAVLVTSLGILLPELLGQAGHLNSESGTYALSSPHFARAAFFDATGTLPVLAMVTIIPPLILLRRRWLALAVTWLALMPEFVFGLQGLGLTLPATYGPVEVAMLGLAVALVLIAWVRFGFLALLTSYFFVARLAFFPITLDMDVWYGQYSRNVLLILGAIALGAAWMAVQRKKDPARMRVSSRQ